MLFLKFLKLFKYKPFKIVLFTLMITTLFAVALFTDGKDLLFKEKEVVAIVVDDQIKHEVKEVNVENIVISESREIDKSFAFEGNHSFDYPINHNYEWINNLEDGFIKDLSEGSFGLKYEIHLKSLYLIGYDHKMYFTGSNIDFDQNTGVLHVFIPKFEVIYKPLFDLMERDKVVGFFRSDYTDNEIFQYHDDAFDFGYNLVIQDPSIIEDATNNIETQIYNRFRSIPEIEGKIKDVEVEFGGEFAKVEDSFVQKYKDENEIFQ